MATEPQQRRIILHLHYGAAEQAIIRTAAELAQMLGLALHGVFLEDAALTELTALPFVREFRLATGAWQKLDRQRIADEQRAAANEARRLLDEAAASFGVTLLFDMVSGDPRAVRRLRRRRPAISSWWRSRGCRRSNWCTRLPSGWRRRTAVVPR